MDRSMPGFPDHYQLLEFTQTYVHWVGDAIQPSHLIYAPLRSHWKSCSSAHGTQPRSHSMANRPWKTERRLFRGFSPWIFAEQPSHLLSLHICKLGAIMESFQSNFDYFLYRLCDGGDFGGSKASPWWTTMRNYISLCFIQDCTKLC